MVCPSVLPSVLLIKKLTKEKKKKGGSASRGDYQQPADTLLKTWVIYSTWFLGNSCCLTFSCYFLEKKNKCVYVHSVVRWECRLQPVRLSSSRCWRGWGCRKRAHLRRSACHEESKKRAESTGVPTVVNLQCKKSPRGGAAFGSGEDPKRFCFQTFHWILAWRTSSVPNFHQEKELRELGLAGEDRVRAGGLGFTPRASRLIHLIKAQTGVVQRSWQRGCPVSWLEWGQTSSHRTGWDFTSGVRLHP